MKGWGATTLLGCTHLVQVNQASISLVVLHKERSWVSIAWTNRALYSMHCIICIVFYALYSMHCILCIVFYALYSMHCILCIVSYALNAMQHRLLFTYIKTWGCLPYKNEIEVHLIYVKLLIWNGANSRYMTTIYIL